MERLSIIILIFDYITYTVLLTTSKLVGIVGYHSQIFILKLHKIL